MTSGEAFGNYPIRAIFAGARARGLKFGTAFCVRLGATYTLRSGFSAVAAVLRSSHK